MDPLNPESFNHRTETLSTGHSYHFVDQKPKDYNPSTALTLLCIHGFPDLWYGWRYQIGPWTRKGYRVVVPDMLGYGGTDKPTNVREYSTKKLSDDMAALLDFLGLDKAVIIGHDWGSFASGRFALWYPERVLALIMMSVPFTPPAPKFISIEEVVKRQPALEYQAYFATEESTLDVEANLSTVLRAIYAGPGSYDFVDIKKLVSANKKLGIATPSVLSDKETEYYLGQFKQDMLGPLSYYRTTKLRYDEEKAAKLPSTLRPDLPVLTIWGTADLTCTPVTIRRAHKFVPRLQDIALEGKGHWLMVEAQEFITEKVLQWLDNLMPKLGMRGKL